MRMELAWLLAAVCIAANPVALAAGFLPALPLRIVVSTPMQLTTAPAQQSISLSGRQALQVCMHAAAGQHARRASRHAAGNIVQGAHSHTLHASLPWDERQGKRAAKRACAHHATLKRACTGQGGGASSFLSASLPTSSRLPPFPPLSPSCPNQVVFSRPVIALGSDFGAHDNFGGKASARPGCEESVGAASRRASAHAKGRSARRGRSSSCVTGRGRPARSPEGCHQGRYLVSLLRRPLPVAVAERPPGPAPHARWCPRLRRCLSR
jgi:hypothetical protein